MNSISPHLAIKVATLLFCLLAHSGWAQVLVTGTVKDAKNETLPSVSILEKGTRNGTLTNADGKFSIKAGSSKAVLVVSFIGYKRQEVTIGNQTNLSIVLQEDQQMLNETVVIGYQSVERRKTTGSVATVKGADIANTPYATFDAMLQGRVAGLSVLSTSGEPGANNIVSIRGSSSVALGGRSAPLYVIDNIVYDVNDISSSYGNSSPLSAINPNDIESIDILKDASSSAIYGARAANGVIIVKTKRPKGGRPEIRVSSYFGIANRPALKPMIVGAAERRMKMNLLMNSGTYAGIANSLSPMLTDSLNPAFNNNTDWQGLFLRTAVISNADASIASAEEKYNYRISLNRYQEQGVMRGYDLSRITPSLAVQFNPTKALQVSNNLFVSLQKSTHGKGDNAYSKYPFDTWNFPSSFWQVRDQEYQLYTGQYDGLRDDDNATTVNGNTNLVLTPATGLVLTSTLAYTYFNNSRDYFRPGLLGDGLNFASTSVNQTRRWEWQNYATYNKVIGEHNTSFLVGQGMEKANERGSVLSGRGGTLTGIKTVAGIAPGANLFGNSWSNYRSRLSFFARASYDYKGRYLLQANYRADGSSRYSVDRQWGNFPSLSLGWIISDEPFFAPIKPIIANLKLRGSYGVTGEDPGNFYAQYQPLISRSGYNTSVLDNGVNDQEPMTTYNGTPVAFPNYFGAAAATNITWMRSPQMNLGIDASLWKDRINLTADFYIRDSQNQVFEIPVGVTTGYPSLATNYVDVRNSGIELTLNTNNLPAGSPLRWTTNFNLAFNRNYVTRLPNGGSDVQFGLPWMRKTLSVGKPLFYYNGWQVDGVYSTNDQVPVDPLTNQPIGQYSSANPYRAGDPIRRDLNGDYIIDDLDKTYLGSPNPKFTGGFLNSFSYKGFSLDVLMTFIQGRQLWNGYLSDKLNGSAGDPYSSWGSVSGPATYFPNGATFWEKPGDQATYAGLLNQSSADKWHIGQSLFVEDASFIRLKNIRLGYAIPATFSKRLGVKLMRVYGVLDNLHVWSRSSVPDPELLDPQGYSSGNDYPLPKKYTFGLELTF